MKKTNYILNLSFREHKGDYGLQRVWATMAALLGGPLAGNLLDMEYGGESGGSRFLPLFWLFTVLRLISSLLILNLDLKDSRESIVLRLLERLFHSIGPAEEKALLP